MKEIALFFTLCGLVVAQGFNPEILKFSSSKFLPEHTKTTTISLLSGEITETEWKASWEKEEVVKLGKLKNPETLRKIVQAIWKNDERIKKSERVDVKNVPYTDAPCLFFMVQEQETSLFFATQMKLDDRVSLTNEIVGILLKEEGVLDLEFVFPSLLPIVGKEE